MRWWKRNLRPRVVSSPLRDAPFDAPFKDVGVGSSLHTDDGFEGTTRVCGKIHIQRDLLQPPTGSKLGFGLEAGQESHRQALELVLQYTRHQIQS